MKFIAILCTLLFFNISLKLFAQVDTLKNIQLNEVEVDALGNKLSDRNYLNEVNGTSIYAAKKSEIILLQNINANVATNNTREIFAKIPGINIWESDEAGVQLGIALRGLNPGRTNELNTRQNGYDISADALGYPENYYVPTAQALEKIEIVRGAASLQYGTQFGGLLNFVMRKPPKNKLIEFKSQQTAGSFGLWNSFNSLGGTKGKFSYYTFFHHKQGDGWRENNGYQVNTGYMYLAYSFSERFKLSLEYTKMSYNLQQPGGLTDSQFAQNARQSFRSRNWFTADWNILALMADYSISEKTKFNTRIFAFAGSRGSIGNLDPISDLINKSDTGLRNLLYDNYFNIGLESRLLHHYSIGKFKNTVLVGFRAYKGNTHRRQGNGTNGSDANYHFLNPGRLENSDFMFPNYNAALFAENIFRISPKLSIIPGARLEYINTQSVGYYRSDSLFIQDNKQNPRSFPLFGIGASYYATDHTEMYANISQAYRAINFNDLKVVNPNQLVNQNLKDATGYNIDLGYRGNYKSFMNFDVSLYFMAYNNRIGNINFRTVDTLTFQIKDYQYRTNVADSRSYGFESFAELDIWKAIKPSTTNSLSIYCSLAYINAFYTNTNDPFIKNKKVELAPNWISRFGLNFKYKWFSSSIRYAYTSDQYSDAQNTVVSSNPINGLVPAYGVMDWSNEVKYKQFNLGFGVNNLLNEKYFTRRASSYPGPGILPSSPRSVYITLGIML